MSSNDKIESLYLRTGNAYRDDLDEPCAESCMAVFEFEEVTHCMGTCTVGANDEREHQLDRDDDIASILRVKCALLSLAQQQMRRLMDDTDGIMNENPNLRNSPWCACLCMLQQLQTHYKAYYCVLLMLLMAIFLFGLLLGAASCGTWLRRFNSPVLTCINSMFIEDLFEKGYRSIA